MPLDFLCIRCSPVRSVIMNVLGFAIACFSLGYALGKDRSTKNDRQAHNYTVIFLINS